MVRVERVVSDILEKTCKRVVWEKGNVSMDDAQCASKSILKLVQLEKKTENRINSCVQEHYLPCFSKIESLQEALVKSVFDNMANCNGDTVNIHHVSIWLLYVSSMCPLCLLYVSSMSPLCLLYVSTLVSIMSPRLAHLGSFFGLSWFFFWLILAPLGSLVSLLLAPFKSPLGSFVWLHLLALSVSCP